MTARSQIAQVSARCLLAGALALLATPLPLLAHATPCELILHQQQTLEWFGYALAANGVRLAVGAPGDPARTEPGAAYVFRRDGTGWSQEDTLPVRGGAAGDRFGSSVALFGGRLAVGAPVADGAGAVYLFSRSGSAWSRESPSRIAAPAGNPGGQFGAAVALGTDTLVVGAPTDSAAGSLAGAVYVFQRTGGGWGPPQRLVAPDAQAAAEFGFAVAIDGDLLAVGAPFMDAPNRNNFGTVYLFERRAEGWTFLAPRLTAGEYRADDAQFGAAVAISEKTVIGDTVHESTVLVGARGDDLQALNGGSVHAFTRSGAPMALPAPADLAAGDQLGWSVAASSSLLLAGAPAHPPRGVAQVFDRGAGTWLNPPRTGSSATSGDVFGRSVAVLGSTALIGGYLDAGGAGSVAYCPISSPPCDQLPAITKTGPAGAVVPGPEISYIVVVANGCSTALPAAQVKDLFDPRLESVQWCRADGDGACTPVSQPGRDIDQVVPLPGNGRVTWRAKGRLRTGSTGELVNQACVSLPDQPALGQGCSQVRNLIGVDLAVTGTASPSSVVKGHLLTIRWVVENQGNTQATGVHLLTGPSALAGGGFNGCLCPSKDGCDLGPPLKPLERREIVLSCAVPACYEGPNPIMRQAEVKANEPELNPTNNTAEVRSPVDNGTADVAVTQKILDAGGVPLAPNARVMPGDRLTYLITVDNNIGPGTACGVVLSDRFPGELVAGAPSDACLLGGQCALDELPMGAMSVLEATFTVGPVAVCPASIPNTATASTQGSYDPDSGNNWSTATVTVDEVDLAITKAGPAAATAGDPLLYTIRASNPSCHDVQEARVSDTFPADLLPAKWCAGTGCTPSVAGNLDLTLHLAPGASQEFHVAGTISPLFQGTLINTARIDTPDGLADDHPENNEATVETTVVWPPGFRLFCTGIEGPSAEGDVITCTLVLLNGGPSAQADNPGDELTDTLPAGLTLLSASADSGVAVAILNTVTWNGAVPVGGQVNITFMAKVNAGTAGTTICNQATAFLDTDGDGVNDTAFLSDLLTAPGPPADPCCFRVLTPQEIPALSQVGMAILILLLAAAAAVRLRAGRAR